ncbi:MAG: hypothetical protein ACYDAJ_08275 [Nitrosotalea sp.]
MQSKNMTAYLQQHKVHGSGTGTRPQNESSFSTTTGGHVAVPDGTFVHDTNPTSGNI